MLVIKRLIVEKHVFQGKHRVFVHSVLGIGSTHAPVAGFGRPELIVLHGTGIDTQIRTELQAVDRQFDIQ